jgi:hypothetical protein
MKNYSLLTFALLFCFNLPAAQAKIEGSINGRIMVSDNRSSPMGVAPASPPSVPVRRVIVSVRAIPAITGGEFQIINPTSFAVTDNKGNFSLPWEDLTRSNFPVSLRVTVWFDSSVEVGATGSTRPATMFRVVRAVLGGNAGADESFSFDVTGSDSNLGTITATANDETAAYLTTSEFFLNIVAGTSVLPERMIGLVVKTRVPGFSFSFGVTPLRSEVFVSAGTPRTAPMVLAHELGHALTWSALGLDVAPIVPLTDYVFPPGGVSPSWDPITREFSKAAFLEGLADAWAVVWAFGSNANASYAEGTNTFFVESARVVDTSSGKIVLNCKKAKNAHEFPFCHTAAVMDLVDNDSGNGDGVNFSLAMIVRILDRFEVCPGNGCLHELGVDALNHHDFRCNADTATRRALIRSVWLLNGINGGPASSCTP